MRIIWFEFELTKEQFSNFSFSSRGIGGKKRFWFIFRRNRDSRNFFTLIIQTNELIKIIKAAAFRTGYGMNIKRHGSRNRTKILQSLSDMENTMYLTRFRGLAIWNSDGIKKKTTKILKTTQTCLKIDNAEEDGVRYQLSVLLFLMSVITGILGYKYTSYDFTT